MIDLGFVVSGLAKSGDYTVRRYPRQPVRDGRTVPALLAAAWAGTTTYILGDLRANGGQVYRCSQPGISASSGGPAGTGTAIADNTCEWDWAGPAISTFTAAGSLQALQGRQVDQLPELLREREVRMFQTEVQLQPASSSGEGDRLVVDGEEWDVQSLGDWDTLGGYYQALVAKPGR